MINTGCGALGLVDLRRDTRRMSSSIRNGLMSVRRSTLGPRAACLMPASEDSSTTEAFLCGAELHFPTALPSAPATVAVTPERARLRAALAARRRPRPRRRRPRPRGPPPSPPAAAVGRPPPPSPPPPGANQIGVMRPPSAFCVITARRAFCVGGKITSCDLNMARWARARVSIAPMRVLATPSPPPPSPSPPPPSPSPPPPSPSPPSPADGPPPSRTVCRRRRRPRRPPRRTPIGVMRPSSAILQYHYDLRQAFCVGGKITSCDLKGTVTTCTWVSMTCVPASHNISRHPPHPLHPRPRHRRPWRRRTALALASAAAAAAAAALAAAAAAAALAAPPGANQIGVMRPPSATCSTITTCARPSVSVEK